MYCYISFVAAVLGAVSGETQLAQIEEHGKVLQTKGDSEVNLLSPISSADSHFTNTSDALKLLDKVYQGHASHAFWKVQDYSGQELLTVPGEPSKAMLYAEIQPQAFMQLLQHVGARAGQKYFDLGSGTGKTVFAAWLLGLNAAGVELAEQRWSTACKAVLRAKGIKGLKKKSKDGPGVTFFHDSLLKVDISDADIIFVNSAMFSKAMMVDLAKKARSMKANSRIISTSGLPGEGFRFDEKVVGPTSMSQGTTWTLQTVIPGAPDLAGAVAAPLVPASLIRQEPKTALAVPAHHTHHEYVHSTGPVLGATKLPDEMLAPAAGSKVCSMEAEEVAAPAPKVLVDLD